MTASQFDLFIENRQKKTRISLRSLTRYVKEILKVLGWKKVSLSLLLVGDREISELHEHYLGDDRPTDVLAFGQSTGKIMSTPRAPFLGDLVVSVERAKQMAPQFGNRWDEELLLYISHGILHLMGHRDSSAAQKTVMDKKQEQILKKVLGKKWRSRRPKPLF